MQGMPNRSGRIGGMAGQLEGAHPSEEMFRLETEYASAITALKQTEIITLLPQSEVLGVIGIDGEEYPAPSFAQLLEIIERNKDLVDAKWRQGFTRLQMTPIAMPAPRLIDCAIAAILKHAAAGTILQTKPNPTDADIPVRVNTAKPFWIWERLRQALDTPKVVYFPQVYSPQDHLGLTKEEVARDARFCAVPGWSVGLIEPIPIMPGQGQGRVIGGRKELEEYSTPRDYLLTLSAPAYQGETGWTPEDFLAHFTTQLESTDQISHDRYDGNALWLLGMYVPNVMPSSGDERYKMQLVPVGYWARDAGRKLYLTTHRTGNRLKSCVARTAVRLSG